MFPFNSTIENYLQFLALHTSSYLCYDKLYSTFQLSYNSHHDVQVHKSSQEKFSNNRHFQNLYSKSPNFVRSNFNKQRRLIVLPSILISRERESLNTLETRRFNDSSISAMARRPVAKVPRGETWGDASRDIPFRINREIDPRFGS